MNLVLNIIILMISLYSPYIFAKYDNTLPRFSSIKSNKVYVRSGPDKSYPINWVFTKSSEPVEVVASFDHWRRIRDKYGDGGWVHTNMLSSKRFVIISGDTLRLMYQKDNIKSKILAKLSPDLRCGLKKISDKWCLLDCSGKKGWVQKEYLWGVYLKEVK